MSKTYPKRLEDFAKKYVPVLRTYLEREELRDIDKVIREELAKKVQGIIDQLKDAQTRQVDSGKLSGLDLLQRTAHKLEKVRDKIKFAVRGYSGIFDLNQMAEEELKGLLDFDQKLFTLVEELNMNLKEILERPSTEIKSALSGFDKKIKNFEAFLEEREKSAKS